MIPPSSPWQAPRWRHAIAQRLLEAAPALEPLLRETRRDENCPGNPTGTGWDWRCHVEKHHLFIGKLTVLSQENHDLFMGTFAISMENHNCFMGKLTISMEHHHFVMGKTMGK